MEPEALLNPFPGLRPFEPDEDHLFFGREKQITALLRGLRTNRFLIVTGSSGSGKSSLVRCGLIPSLYGGLMAKAGSNWRVAIFRPGENPIRNLASSLNRPDILGNGSEPSETGRMVLDITLRRSTLGLIEAVSLARIPERNHVVVLVDQFEELFRFRNSRDTQTSRDEAGAFVKLLLEAVQQETVPIYVVLTMRADFIGDCMSFPGLPETINTGQYLVPRMTRDQLRSAITGPVAVGGGEIAPRLVSRLLNDCGDDPDQLPVLQHALMRTWDSWSQHRKNGQPIDIPDYEAIGTMRAALSLHAEEAYQEIGASSGESMVQRMFKALTDTSADAKGVRRPTSVQELAAICDTSEATIIEAVEVFRRPGRSFLMPPASTPLESCSIIDVSHESLMRCWTRLITWTEEERASADYYKTLARAACSYEQGTAGLWRDPELEIGLRWRTENRPTAAWARRIDPNFERAMIFLDRSTEERDLAAAERRKQRKRRLIEAWAVAGILALVAAFALYERMLATGDLQLAEAAVDTLLAPLGGQSAEIAAQSPDVEQFLLAQIERAEMVYQRTLSQGGGKEFAAEGALVHSRKGDRYRLLGETDQAVAEYETAIKELTDLTRGSPRNRHYPALLANAYNWLGETERPFEKHLAEAENAYNSALGLQQELHREFPHDPSYQLSLAQTYYNRGILRADGGRSNEAESDYREAIALLTPLAQSKPSAGNSTDPYQQGLARAENNLAKLIFDAKLPGDPSKLYQEAIRVGEMLVKNEPKNRDYKLELAEYYDNSAIFLQDRGRIDPAMANSEKAVALYQQLTRPLPAWMMQLGLAHDIRGRILESNNLAAAQSEYQQSIDTFEQIADSVDSRDFHLWYGQALANMASSLEDGKKYNRAIPLLLEAVDQHQLAASKYDLGWDYFYLGTAYKKLGLASDMQKAIANLENLLPHVPNADQQELRECLGSLRQ